MGKLTAIFFPPTADNTVRGSRIPLIVFILLAGIGTVRSCIHIFASDGGAGSIAGMNLAVSGASEVIFAFALWGSEQLIYAIIQWVIILRYRSLIPLMWGIQLLETLGRVLVGHLKPITFAHTPPGQVGNDVLIPLAGLMLVIAVWSGMRESSHSRTLSTLTEGA